MSEGIESSDLWMLGTVVIALIGAGRPVSRKKGGGVSNVSHYNKEAYPVECVGLPIVLSFERPTSLNIKTPY